MAYETKVILAMLADRIALADSAEEAYNVVVRAASVEGLDLPDYENARMITKNAKNKIKEEN